MPELHSYQVDTNNELADYTQGEQYTTPLDTYLKTRAERGWEYGITQLGFHQLEINSMNQDQYYDPNSLEPIENKWIDSKEAKDKYGISVNSGQKITQMAAEKVAQLKARDQQREQIIARGSSDAWTQALGFGAEAATTFLDPINLGAAFVPIVGEARGLMLMERFGPTAGRLITGAVEGAVGNAALEPFTYNMATSLNYEYDAFDSFLNIAAGGIIGAGAHAIGGKIADVFGISEWSRRLETGNIPPETHHNMLRTTVSQLMEDQKIQVSPILRSTLDELHPNLNSISSIRMMKSAEASAGVFEDSFKAQDALLTYREDIQNLLSDAEKQIMDATSTKDIVEAQSKIGSKINNLTERLNAAQKELEAAPASARTTLSREMAAISEELKQNQGILDNLLETRKYVDTLKNDFEMQSKGLQPDQRANIDATQADPTLMLNIEKYKDQNYAGLDKLDFNAIKSETDKAILRKAILAAQDINNLDQVTPEQLMELATKQSTLEGKWYYDPKISEEIDKNLEASFKNYDDTDAKTSLDETMAQVQALQKAEVFSEADVEELAAHDEKISLSKSIGEAIKSAATCVIREMI